MTRILIADDHAVVREGIRQIIARTSDLKVVGEARTGQEALRKAGTQECDVVILDISLPDISGIEVLKQIRRLKPKLAVLILSVYSEEAYALRALKAGASGYLTKEATPDHLLVAIRKVSLGGKYVSPSLAEALAREMESESERAPHPVAELTHYAIRNRLAD